MDEHRPLCEACGYDLDGLDLDSACPECSRPVAHSHPQSRKGSPWQQRRGLFSWWHTNYLTLRHPAALFDTLRLDPRTGRPLAILNCLVAATIMVAPWTGALIGDPVRSARGSGFINETLTLAWVIPAQVGFVTLILLALTTVEYFGVRFIAARRGWRLTRAGASQVCCHATVGWLLLSLAPFFALAIIYTLRELLRIPLGKLIDLRHYGLDRFSIGTLLMFLLPFLALLAGIFAYELLVFLGVRRCRFAAAMA